MADNLSWSVNLEYTGKAEQNKYKDLAKAMEDAKLAAEWSPTGTGTTAPGGGDPETYRGFLDSLVRKLMNDQGNATVTVDGSSSTISNSKDLAGKTNTSGIPMGTPAGSLDWKKRSKQICDQAKARGLQAREFGCLDNPDSIKDENFSWRGYARMVCNRLATHYDPGVPELCGCPPPTWIGWKP